MKPERDFELATLLSLAQKGDQEAYARFLSEAASLLRAYLFHRMEKARDSVEDVLQDSLLAVHRSRHTYSPGRPVGPWLYAIGHHRMISFFRRLRRSERVETLAAQTLDAVGPEATENSLGALVREMLARLPHKQRLVIESLKLQDLSVKEVSLQTGMSESAVKVTAFRGYEAIRRIMGAKRK